MFRSLQTRLLALLVLLMAATVAAGVLMVDLFQQSATARVGQADAQIGRACDAIADAYRFYSSGWHGPRTALEDETFRSGLTTVVQTALRDRPSVEGGIWQRSAGSLAYAYPTYEGSGPKTDVPQAELPRIREANRIAIAEEHPTSSRYAAASQTLLVTACPLAGPIPDLTAWTMTRVITFSGRAYGQLMSGLAVLLATVLAAAILLIRLTLSWSRHVAGIEAILAAHDIAELPRLPLTGERELDRIVTALNDAGARLSEARRRADTLARQVATGERLAAIGRVVAGVAHEIRNPIAAMRLKAENALLTGSERHREALSVILGQIERLDRLLRRLLDVTEPERPRPERLVLATFLESCLSAHRELADARGLQLECQAQVESTYADSELMRRALDNLLLNAIQAAPVGSRVQLLAFARDAHLVLSVRDQGTGPPPDIRDHLFEPFVTGRSDGTGLGLSLVREVAEAHGGSAQVTECDRETHFEIILPWQPS
jgi:signal transduction histidine kinase